MVVFSCVHAPNPAHADCGCYCRTNRLRKDGAAEKTKQLQIFDHLVSINGEASDGISHDSAVHILERSQAEITLEVQTLEGAQDANGVVGNWSVYAEEERVSHQPPRRCGRKVRLQNWDELQLFISGRIRDGGWRGR